MRNNARCNLSLSRVAAITVAWRRALSLGLLGVMLGSTPVEAQPFAYVTNFGANTVSVIDTVTNTVVATVPVGSGPLGVAITPDGTRAYVANSNALTVSVIDTATNTVVATVPVGTFPNAVAFTPDGTDAYVTTHFSASVLAIETATNTVVARVQVGLFTFGVAITPDATHVYVTIAGIDNGVSVIDTATNTVVAQVQVGSGPMGVAITPDGTHAYVSNLSNTVSVIDTATNTVVATVPVEHNAFGVAITPDGTHAYVTTVGFVSVIDTATNTVVATVPVGSRIPHGVAITPDGTHAYVAYEIPDTVWVIDTTTNTVVATVPVGSGPMGVAITPRPVTFACPLGQGFWKNHSDTWPVTSLTLGSQTYTQAELLALFDTPPSGDASVILAYQLIAAKLNIANGSNPAPIRSTIADADTLLSQFLSTLPYNVGTSSDVGQRMVNDANGLNRYNNGDLTPNCRPQSVPEAVVRK